MPSNADLRHRVMVIDGNDDRGTDVGVMCRFAYEIVSIRSHVDDADALAEIFSRDCPEYTITTPTGARVVVPRQGLVERRIGA